MSSQNRGAAKQAALAGQSPVTDSPLQTLTHNLPAIIYRIYLRENNRTEFFNDMLEVITGYTPADLVAGVHAALIHPEDRERVTRAVNRAVKENIPFDVEYRLKTRTGEVRHVSEIGRPTQGADGAPLYIDGIISDITARKQAEQELRASEERYRHLYRAMTELVAMHEMVYDDAGRPADYRITDCNPAFSRITGIPYEKAVGNLASQVYGVTPPPYLDIYASVAESGTPTSFEVYYQPLDKHFLITAFSPAKGRFATVTTDITAHKQGEDQLREKEGRLWALINNTPNIAIETYDLEGRVIEWNRAAEAIFGFTRAEAVGRTLDKLFLDAPNAAEFARILREVDRTHKPAGPSEWSFTAKDGSLRTVLSTIFAIPSLAGRKEFVCMDTDITALIRANAELAQAQALLKTAIAESPAGIVVADARTTEVIIFNQATSEILGLGPVEVRPGVRLSEYHPSWQAFRPDGSAYRMEEIPIMRTISAGETVHNEEMRIRRADGTDRWIIANSAPVRNVVGDITAGIIVYLDITEQRRADEERRKLEAQVQHAQKLESLGVLAGGIAHDFNNLLMAILGNIDLALGELSPVSPVRDNLLEVEAVARRAADLCRQMLAYSGKGKLVIEPIDLNELVVEMGHMLEVSISKKAVLRHSLAEHLPAIEADATQLRQVIMNLVINASEAIGDRSGVIAITTGALDCDAAYLVGTLAERQLPEGRYVFLEVADSGVGMDRATLAKIFDPFFTTKVSGRGLGLAAVMGIVRGHRGAVKVYSEPGKGTTFKVFFPAIGRPAKKLREAAAPADGWKGSGTVLLVDDEDSIRALGKRILERLGFQALVAPDGRAALEVFKEKRGEIICVLLDLTMPHMDGEETFRELRRIAPDVRVIMSSGYNDNEIMPRFAGKGLAGFIQKPYQLSTLAQKMREIVGGGTSS